MFPNSPNTLLFLLTVAPISDSVGNRKYKITSKKQVAGCTQSITINEQKLSVEIKRTFDLKVKILSFLFDNNIYVQIEKQFYKVERTYSIGQFVELYLSKTNEELIDES